MQYMPCNTFDVSAGLVQAVCTLSASITSQGVTNSWRESAPGWAALDDDVLNQSDRLRALAAAGGISPTASDADLSAAVHNAAQGWSATLERAIEAVLIWAQGADAGEKASEGAHVAA